jgi:mannose-1-phosphate guanylyltransferase
MPRQRLRALVLSAGYGTRLRPLTDTHPKPLLPVAGVPILGHALDALARAGCEAAALNLHYHGEAIRRHFGAEHKGMPLVYSDEPKLLGTLGALVPLRDFFAPADLVLLVNGDSLCHWPLRALVRRHRRGNAAATLLLASRPDPAEFGGGVGLDREERVLSFRRDPTAGAQDDAARRVVFAGAHVFAPHLVEGVGPGFADIVRDLYEPLLAERPGCLAGLVTGRLWHDLGTPRRYRDGVLAWMGKQAWTAPGAEISPKATVRRSAVEAGARIEAGAMVESSVLLPGATVGAGARVVGSVVGFGATVPAKAAIEDRLVTPAPEPEAIARFTPFAG